MLADTDCVSFCYKKIRVGGFSHWRAQDALILKGLAGDPLEGELLHKGERVIW